MKLKKLNFDLTVCKIKFLADIPVESPLFFIGKTDEELSLVCLTKDAPEETEEREDGWKGFRVEGVLDFSLTGILSGLSQVLAEKGIGIFAVSTYNTDYILVKEKNFESAMQALTEAGYEVA